MSVARAGAADGTRAGTRPARAVSGARGERLTRLPVRALLGSRLLVLVAGAVGVLTTVKHDPIAAAQTLRRLGPVGNVLAGSVDRFDSGYYLDIANHGFGAVSTGRLAFFPLYPLMIRMLTPLTGSAVIAGAAISLAAFAGALALLHRLTERELGGRAADATVLLLAFAPLSFFFTAIYTESLFLALSLGSVAAARAGRWRLACGLGALATLTRSTGVVLVLALAVIRRRAHPHRDPGLAAVLVLPAALLGYMAALAARGYPFLGVFAAQSKWGRTSVGPLTAVAAAVWSALRGAWRIAHGGSVYDPVRDGPLSNGAESIVLLAVLILACLALAWVWRSLPREYGVLAGIQLLLCLSSPAVGQPLWSLDRFVLTIFPLWMAAGAWIARRPRLLAPAVLAGGALLVFYTLQFSSWSFVA